MDSILRELFGRTDDEPTVAPAASPSTPSAAAAAATGQARAESEAEREARREARRQRREDPERRQRRREFIERYITGNPAEGFTAEEALAHLDEMRDELSPEEFQLAMVRTMDNLLPDQRDAFITLIRKSREADTAAGAAPAAAASAAPAPSGDPFGGLLTGLMGGRADAGGVTIGDVLADLRRGGLNAPGSTGKTPTEADFMRLIDSPLGRAVLGGLAAYGLQDLEQDEEDQERRAAPGPGAPA